MLTLCLALLASSNDIVATVNGEPITRAQFLAEAVRHPHYPGPDQTLEAKVRQRIIETAIDNLTFEAYIAQKAKELRVDLAGIEAEAAALLEEERRKLHVSEAEFAPYIAAHTIDYLRRLTRERVEAKASGGKRDSATISKLYKEWRAATKMLVAVAELTLPNPPPATAPPPPVQPPPAAFRIDVLWGCKKGGGDCLDLGRIEFWCPTEAMAGEDPCQLPDGPEREKCMNDYRAGLEDEAKLEASKKAESAVFVKNALMQYAGPARLRVALPRDARGKPFLFAAPLSAEYPDEPVLSGDTKLVALKRTGDAALVPMPLGYSLDPKAGTNDYLFAAAFFAKSRAEAEATVERLQEDCKDGCNPGDGFATALVNRKCLPVAMK